MTLYRLIGRKSPACPVAVTKCQGPRSVGALAYPGPMEPLTEDNLRAAIAELRREPHRVTLRVARDLAFTAKRITRALPITPDGQPAFEKSSAVWVGALEIATDSPAGYWQVVPSAVTVPV
jgi:hypothetical protein